MAEPRDSKKSVIIYPNDTGGISVIYPIKATVSEMIERAVPDGLPYRIIPASEIPKDREHRNLWSADFSNPDGYGTNKKAI